MSAKSWDAATASEFVKKNLVGIAAGLGIVVVAGLAVWTRELSLRDHPGLHPAG